MTLLPTRRAAIIAPLAASLRAELQPLLDREPYVPDQKALLSRDGGRCARDGATLAFDPYSPHAHRCPICGTVYEGERHDRWWITWYQLWLAERAVRAAALHAVGATADTAPLARAILDAYAERYLQYPNVDNVLGPSRPFFSTYLESIWLLQLAVALDLLEISGAAGTLGARVRERILEPSVELIASFDEGMSNRQVWNDAALLAGARLLVRAKLAERAVEGASGVVALLRGGMLSDGTWYEGENYHLFAHRGLWYGITMAEEAGVALPGDLVARFDEGFATPLLTALPDLTFPSRRDSQYAVSLRQWRFAESFELGLARRDDERLLGGLWALYRGDIPRRDTGRWRSTAEAERNEPPSSLGRADLGWRSLLCARAALPPLEPIAPRSVLLESQGLGVLRRETGRVYIALDYGHAGGGHGHPDRLNLILQHGDERILDDMGTGSYVDPSLHWYRSALAHNAPLVDGTSPREVDGVLRAWVERGDVGWIEGELATSATVVRSVVVTPSYAVDEVRWRAPVASSFALPLHVTGTVRGVGAWREAPLFDALSRVEGVRGGEVAPVQESPLHLELTSARADAWIVPDREAELWRARAPGPPGTSEREFFALRMRGTEARLVTVWSWSNAVLAVAEESGRIVVRLADGTRDEHERDGENWVITTRTGDTRSVTVLAGRDHDANTDGAVPPRPKAEPASVILRADAPLTFELGREHYRRSEASWEDAGAPTARVTIALDARALTVDVEVRKRPLLFRPADAPDPALDNEPPDIHSDGVQLYLGDRGWLAVPDRDGGVRVSRVGGERDPSLCASWRETAEGYAMRVVVPRDELTGADDESVVFDVLVNDMAPGRERRRGQLVLSGGAGEFVYLRGDRQEAARRLRLVLA